MFLKLTHTDLSVLSVTGDQSVWINMDRIEEFYAIPKDQLGGTTLHRSDGETPSIVDESPDQIMKMLLDS